jgi:hypothetical protein
MYFLQSGLFGGFVSFVAFTLGRALADPEVIEISERQNRLSYGFQ